MVRSVAERDKSLIGLQLLDTVLVMGARYSESKSTFYYAAFV